MTCEHVVAVAGPPALGALSFRNSSADSQAQSWQSATATTPSPASEAVREPACASLRNRRSALVGRRLRGALRTKRTLGATGAGAVKRRVAHSTLQARADAELRRVNLAEWKSARRALAH